MYGNGKVLARKRQHEQAAGACVLRIEKEAAARPVLRDAAEDLHIFRHARECIKHRLEVEPLACRDEADSPQMFFSRQE